MKTIAVLNLKGGVGKTTTATNLAYELSRKGQTLLIDADKQGNASEFYGRYDDDTPAALGRVLEQDKADFSGAPYYVKTDYDGLYIMPANTGLMKSNLALLMNPAPRRETRLARFLRELEPAFQFCVIDCAPDIDMATINALMAADIAIVPVTLDKNACKGLREVWEQINAAIESGNQRLCGRVLVTRYRASEQADKISLLSGYWRIGTRIRESTEKAETSNDAGRPLSIYSRYSNAARDYRRLADELLNYFAHPATATCAG